MTQYDLSYKLFSQVVFGESLEVLSRIAPSTVDLVYIDPPSSTSMPANLDNPKHYLEFLEARIREAYRVLMGWGSMYVHLDQQNVHRVKVLLDSIFGSGAFMNEAIWTYFNGRNPKYRWSAKPDNILVYAKYPKYFIFNKTELEREPIFAPGLVPAEKATAGRPPTDDWLQAPLLPRKENTGYPGQKPLELLKRIITASSNPGDLVLDFFAGSGTTGEAALLLGRQFILADNNLESMKVMAKRFSPYEGIQFVGFSPDAKGK